MRTESKVDSIVLDWLREGLSEKLDQLLRALEDLSGGTGGAEHIYESLQAVKTMDAVLSIADFQVLRVLLKEEMAALVLLETKPPQVESLLYAVTEAAWLLRSIFDRLSIGATVNAMSLVPMINRLRSAQSLPLVDTENVLARASIIWSESRVTSAPYRTEGGVIRVSPATTPTTPKVLLTQMEQQILQLLRGNTVIISDLLKTFDLIIDNEVNPAVIVATRVFEELLNAIHDDQARYLPLVQRVIGRILKLFRMELQGREALQIRHEAIEFATDLLLELLKILPDDRVLCGEGVGHWREILSTTGERTRFLGLESDTLKQVAEALSEELNAAQDVLDIFVRGAKTDLEPLVRIQPRLEQIIGVLDTLNYADEAKLIQAALNRLIQVVRGAELLDDDFLMELAVAVMTSEQVVSQIGQFIVEVGDRPSMIDRVVRQSRLALATACYEDILAAKEIVNKSLSAAGLVQTTETLADAVGLVHGVRNALSVAELTAAMPLIAGLHEWLSLHADRLNQLPPKSMSALAEVSAAIEFYLENLRDYQKELIQYLDGPRAMLSVLLTPVPASAESFALEMAVSETDSVVDSTVDTDRDALSLSLDEWSPDSMPQSSTLAIEPELPVDESLASIDDLIAQLSGEDAAPIDSTEHTLTESAQDVEQPLIEETDPTHQPVPTAEFDEAMHLPADIAEASIDAQALPEVLGTSVDTEAVPVADPTEPAHEMFPPLDLAEAGAAPVDQEAATASPFAVDESETLPAWEDEAGQAPSTEEESVADSLAWPELDAGAAPSHQQLDVIESAGLEGSDSVEEDLALPRMHGEAESPVPMAAVDDIVDEELDPLALEMRMVFAEEMADTLPEMQDASNRWLTSGDRDDLAVLRRGFHTIKGSSRMVGLTMIGDWGWSYENLLTCVLDGRIVATEPLRADVSASVLLAASALPVLEKGREPPVSFWQASQSAAERWTSTQGISSDREEMDNDEFDGESIAGTESAAASEIGVETEGLFESTDNSGETLEAEGMSVPELDGSIQEEKTVAAAIVGSEPTDLSASVEPRTALPVIDDPILREIFDTESSGYIQQLQQQITHAMDNHLPLACDKELVRLVHTLLGSARTAGVQPIANIAGRLEEWVQLLEEHQRVLEYVNLDVFRQALIVMDQIRLWAIDPNFPQPDSHPIEMRIATKIDEALAQIVPNSACDENEMQGALVSSLEADERELMEEAFPVPLLAEDDGFFGQQPVAEFLLAPRPDDQPAEQDPDILQIFLEEAEELLEKADGYIAHWRSHPHDLDSIRLLHRNLHTLKGGARMAGLLNLADVTHLLEDRLDRARDQGGDQAEQLVVLVQQTYDALGKMLDLVRRQESVPAQVDLLAMIVAEQTGRKIPGAGVDIVRTAPEIPVPIPVVASHEQPSMAYAPTEPEVQSAVPVTPAPVASLPDAPAEELQGAPATSTAAEVRREQIRVDADRIDSLVNQVGENVLLQARVDRQVSGFERQLFELQQTLSRLRGQLRRLEIETESQMKTELMVESGLSAEEFDPLEFDRFTHVQELSRGIMESLGDISSIEEAMSDLTEQSQLLLLQQSRLGRKLQDGMLALRMVRFNDVVGRLRRIVRQVGDEVGRSAELVVHNGETELDRVTLVGLLPSLEHMIRNSLAHGIEQAEERRAKGKPEMGKIEITIESSGGNVTLELKDDGRGLDLDTIRRKAIERKLITEDIELTDDEARSLIFLPGFSTAGNVSQVSGRGVGMDVVAGSVREMGGFVDLQSEYGVYTRIQLNLPLTQAMTRGILVSVGDERFAIPYKGVVSVTRMTTIQLAEQYASDKPAVTLGGERYPLFSLGELMTHEPFNRENQETGIRPVFLFKLGERRFAIQVDHQLGGIQLFVKSLGPQLGRIPGLSGATIADDGNVILVLELFELVRQFQRRDDRDVDLTAVLDVRRRPMILVVDDSLTVRKVTARTLERNNLDVILARDGVEALGVLHEQRPDLVLTDIEMPRMDGFELLGAIRNDPQTRSVPVIMISSRTGQKHRSRAEALGVSAYLGKPYAEVDLITRIEQFIANKRGALLTTDSTTGMAQTVKGDEA